MKTYTVAVVGALGVVGSAMIEILEELKFPVKDLVPLDQATQLGKQVTFRGKRIEVKEAKKGAFKGVDIAFFSAGGEASLELAPIAVSEGCTVIDNSSAWRMDPQVPLVIPEVNPQDLDWHRGIIANPNCSTVQMLVALKPIHDAFQIKRIVVSTYQAVSGSGKAAMDELTMQVADMSQGIAPLVEAYPHQIAFNAIPHIDVFQENGYTKEEMKVVWETRKIFDLPNLPISCTSVRVPILRVHSESITIETEKSCSPEIFRNHLEKTTGIDVIDRPKDFLYPMPLTATGKYNVEVGRIRKNPVFGDFGLDFFVCGDQLLRGASLNAVEIFLKIKDKE
jgi:aspartate-semialdehyde dehydrogenase